MNKKLQSLAVNYGVVKLLIQSLDVHSIEFLKDMLLSAERDGDFDGALIYKNAIEQIEKILNENDNSQLDTR